MENYEPRYYTNKLIALLDDTGELSDVVINLLNFMSEDDVKDFCDAYGYFEDEEEEEEDW